MIDADYLKKILGTIDETKYDGIASDKLMEQVCEAKLKDISDVDINKFKYHMDELWRSGLIIDYYSMHGDNWGYILSDEGITLNIRQLLLSPVGGQFYIELCKPTGVKKFKKALIKFGPAIVEQGISAAFKVFESAL
ncbi:hypothetical protein [Alishewanella sp. SMS8]|uniref:hypothetical protein n=1 Tax=Alishewanella sp. SMS8 TaxID=2994676 RepID=UPI00274243BF|nr:hypothetical protein [Alishewanella sp. SMS8]MDP5206348.1 hypothetical protein [Alishewanella sp. SMS9]MDP5459905.1 hypothetical protein [Alishewanella sp. SMS8]